MSDSDNDGLQQILSVIDDHKQHMSDQCYIDLTDKLQEIFLENHGNFTTNFREMYHESEKTCSRLRAEVSDLLAECFPSEIDMVEGSFHRKIWKTGGTIHRDGEHPAIITRYDDGITKKLWYNNGKLHSPAATKGPAKQWINEHTGQLIGCTWYENGCKHRAEAEGPAKVKLYARTEFGEAVVKKIAFYRHGHLHREIDSPAVIKFYPNGNVEEREWYICGKLHREDQPAREQYNMSGGIKLHEFYKHGKFHSYNDNAAIVIMNDETRTCLFKWFSNGVLHRVGQPAIMQFMNGTISSVKYYFNGNLHRDDGPALEIYHGTQKLMSNWYTHGVLTRRG